MASSRGNISTSIAAAAAASGPTDAIKEGYVLLHTPRMHQRDASFVGRRTMLPKCVPDLDSRTNPGRGLKS
eukprot:9929254-Prorocentrum_lima.AAC.1